MSHLLILHLGFLGVWLVLVVIETFLEFRSSRQENALKASLSHFWIDVSAEVPLVVGVLVTGALLLEKMPYIPLLFKIKVALALIAIAFNLTCFVFVVQRYKNRNNPQLFALYNKRVRLTWVGVPFGLAALYIGLKFLVLSF